MFVNVSVAVSNETVPVKLGKVIVLSAVGSVTAIVVSKLSAVLPSNTIVGLLIVAIAIMLKFE